MVPLFFLLLFLASPYITYVFFREIIREHKQEIRATAGGALAWTYFVLDVVSMVFVTLLILEFVVKAVS